MTTSNLGSGIFFFDPDDPIYADHFPGSPVVPGSLIIQAFVTAVRSCVAAQGACSIENFRFKRFISPGKYAFRLSHGINGNDVRCPLYENESPAVTGTLRIGALPRADRSED